MRPGGVAEISKPGVLRIGVSVLTFCVIKRAVWLISFGASQFPQFKLVINLMKSVDRKFRAARIWSNQELKTITPHCKGAVINVSAWKDEDKEGAHYKDYFS